MEDELILMALPWHFPFALCIFISIFYAPG
jgi:hypothetical protein